MNVCLIVHISKPKFISVTKIHISSIQSLSRVWLFVTPWAAAHQASLSITNSRSLLKLMSTESVMPTDHLMLCRPLLILPSIFPSIKVFSNESVLLIRWCIFSSAPKCWSFSFNISPSVLPRTAFQGALKSLFQRHSSKASILQCSAFLMVQLTYVVKL